MSAGISFSEPLHAELGLFCNQDNVDAFVTTYIKGHQSVNEVIHYDKV